MITLGLDRGDVEHFMDDSDKFRLVIGTEAGESRAIDAIEEVLKKLGSVIEEVDHAKYTVAESITGRCVPFSSCTFAIA